MARSTNPRPIGADRTFHAEPVFRETPDLHKLAQALLSAAIRSAQPGNPALTRPQTVEPAVEAS